MIFEAGSYGDEIWPRNEIYVLVPLLPLVKGGRGLARHTRNFLRDQPNHGDTACSAQRKQIATKPARLDAPYLWESWDILFVVIGFVCLER